MNTPLREVDRAARALRRQEEKAERARGELYAAVITAHKAGESMSLIAHVAGISRQAVWKIVQAAK